MSRFKHDIASVSVETGLSKETICKWEARYGFPKPQRNGQKERFYSTEQIRALREAHRLITSGMRPKHALLSVETNQPITSPDENKYDFLPISKKIISALINNDRDHVHYLLQRALISHGVISFLEGTLAIVNHDIGIAWSHGLIKIYQEHLYSDTIQALLNKEILDIPSYGQGPVEVLLATPPGEIHTIGIQMVELWLKFNGIRSISLGAQVPISELVEASQELKPKAIGISISSAYTLRHSLKFTLDLCSALPDEMIVWLGGAGVSYKEKAFPANVKLFQSIQYLNSVLNEFSSHIEAS